MPIDMWRELCWRYVVYPCRLDGGDAEVVFAVQLKRRRPVVQAAVLPLAPDWPGGRTGPVPGPPRTGVIRRLCSYLPASTRTP